MCWKRGIDETKKPKKMKTILELTSSEARKYFMEPKNYCTLDLPDYINFKPVLNVSIR